MTDQALYGTMVSSSSNDQLVLHGLMTRACAKKFRDSFQALVQDVQALIGDTRGIQGLNHDETTLHTLIQVIEKSEVVEVQSGPSISEDPSLFISR